jgi:hypothetical protein
MDENIVQEILHELFSALETLETQNGAVLQLLKDKGIATDQDLAVQLKKAGDSASVRWVAVRARIDRLVSSAVTTEAQSSRDVKKDSAQPSQEDQKRNKDAAAPSHKSENEKGASGSHGAGDNDRTDAEAPDSRRNRKEAVKQENQLSDDSSTKDEKTENAQRKATKVV